MRKFKWLICFIVALCMICGLAFAGCTVGEVQSGDTGTTGEEGEGGGNEGENGGGTGSENEGGGSGSENEGGSGTEGNEGSTGSGNEGEGGEDDNTVTINVDLPANVSIKSSYSAYDSTEGTITGTIGASLTLPTSSDMEIPTDTTFGTRTLQGWYVKGSYTSESATACTMLSGTTYTLPSSTVTIAPYWSYPLGVTSLYFNSGSNDNYTGGGAYPPSANASGCTYTDYHTDNKSAYTTVLDPVVADNDSSFDYAVPGVMLVNSSSSRGVQVNDKFRIDTSFSISPKNDNIFFYEFQNQGTDEVYFKFYLVNSGTTQDSSYMYIYLAPGETVTYVISDEMSSGNDSNGNTMIYLQATKASDSLNLAVACGVLAGTSTSEHAGSFTASNFSSQGFKLYTASKDATEGNYSSESYTETSFVAYITNSTKGDGVDSTDVYNISGTYSTSTTSLLPASIIVEEPIGAETQESSGSDD